MSTQKTSTTETATLAGGCFWGVEDLLRKIPGVTAIQVGYSGGNAKNPTYDLVKTGLSGHAEAVQVEFDPQKLSFESLLRKFFALHDPTTVDQQGNDRGSQYRSAIFFHSETQKETAQKVIDIVNKSGAWKNPVVTQVIPFSSFTPAEEYHQDYLVKNPNGYTCHYFRKVNY